MKQTIGIAKAALASFDELSYEARESSDHVLGRGCHEDRYRYADDTRDELLHVAYDAKADAVARDRAMSVVVFLNKKA